jgi:hypothetical protein
MAKTRKNGRGSTTRGWKNQKPGYHQRTVMLKRCGKKCFLGPEKSYPICTKNTCKVNPKGVYSAYIRSRQFHRKSISNKAKKLLIKMGIKKIKLN